MVTINDVAKSAGVSRSTASRAFSQNSSIRPATRQKVLQAAQRLGYSPNLNAKGLVEHKHYMIGVFFSRLHADNSTYFSNIIGSVNSQLPNNYVISVQGITQIRDFGQTVQNRIDGAIVFSQTPADDPFINQLIAARIKTVVVLRRFDSDAVDNVYPDDGRGISNLVDYLHNMGHKQIGFINGPDQYTATHVRYAALKEASKRVGITILPTAVKWGHFTLESGEKLMASILQQLRERWPSCVVCASDDIALGAIKACHQYGIHVPNDISIVGFDNIPYASVMTPSLTTVTNPLTAMATEGVKLLFTRINGQNEAGKQSLIISPQLVLRSSVRNFNH